MNLQKLLVSLLENMQKGVFNLIMAPREEAETLSSLLFHSPVYRSLRAAAAQSERW